MNQVTKTRLSFMMFLQFFIWGAWFVTMGTYLSTELSAEGAQIGQAYETQAIGAILAPFIIGLIADRFFPAQIILGVLHLVGAALMYMAAQTPDFAGFYPYILIYMVLYMPTLALVNSVSFRQMNDPSSQFAHVRIWGTIGWIIAGMLIGYVFLWETNGMLKNTFYLSAGASALLGLYSFTLPATPPKNKGEKTTVRDILGLEALGLLKDRNYLVFFIASILICIPLAFYYQNANIFLNEVGMANAAGNMSWGQISEVLFMLALPVFLKKYGIKKTLLLGMFAWVLRYLLFAYGDAGSGVWMLFLGILLHGICYDFFFVSGQIFTDHKAGEKIQSAAQGLITLATYGVGMLIGFRLAGLIYDQNALDAGGHAWQNIWIIPAAIAGVVAILYWLTFKNEKIDNSAI
jgi:nucleoside transporter